MIPWHGAYSGLELASSSSARQKAFEVSVVATKLSISLTQCGNIWSSGSMSLDQLNRVYNKSSWAGETCGLGKRRKVKFVFTCAQHFTLDDGPMVVFQHPNGCEYEVQWPSPVGCPADPALLNKVGVVDHAGSATSTGKSLLGVVIVLAGLAIGAFLYKRQQKGNSDYTNL